MEMTQEVKENEPVEAFFKWLIENTVEGSGSPAAPLTAPLNSGSQGPKLGVALLEDNG